MQTWHEAFSPIFRSGQVTRWLGPVTIAVAGLLMLWWSWGTWPDVRIDDGAQLYYAWRITDGEVLSALAVVENSDTAHGDWSRKG